MRFSSIFVGLAGATAAVAAALPKPEPVILNQDDIVLYGNGKTQIMKRSEWQKHEEERLAKLNERALAHRSIEAPASPPQQPEAGAVLDKRDCTQGEVDEIQVLTEEHFLQWDVVMSPVITARYDQALVSVTQGYSIANSVAVQESVKVGIEDFFDVTYQISFETTWTTTNTQTFSYYLNPTNESKAMYGCIISNPVTTRYSGNYITGCAESPTKTAWSADVYAQEVKSNDLTWVEGAIGLAASTQYPVPCLIGECEHK